MSSQGAYSWIREPKVCLGRVLYPCTRALWLAYVTAYSLVAANALMVKAGFACALLAKVRSLAGVLATGKVPVLWLWAIGVRTVICLQGRAALNGAVFCAA